MRVGKMNKNKNGMRAAAALLAAALFLSEVPVTKLQAAQTESTQPAETQEPEESTSNAETQEPEESTSNAETQEPEESTSNAETQEPEESTSNAETQEPEESTSNTETQEPEENAHIRYILGREMTAEEMAAQKALEPAYLPELEVFELPEGESFRHPAPSINRAPLEAKYDSRDAGLITSVKNQNPWGTCWAFSTLSVMETALIKQGLAAADSIDLSEKHLAYFVGHTGYDMLGNAAGDTITVSPDPYYYLDRGGNIYYAAMKLMNWHGAAEESGFPYQNSNNVPDLETIDAQSAVSHIKDLYYVGGKPNDRTTIDNIKALVKEYGSVVWSYYHDEKYLNRSTYGYYSKEYNSTNHAITVVGWDDTYAKENFGTDHNGNLKPASDGAWIVKNSWSPLWGDNGYFYISYEDLSLGSGNAAGVVVANPAEDYDNNYFYGNTTAYAYVSSVKKAAQVYEVKGLTSEKENLCAVSFMPATSNAAYSIQIYKNPALTDGVVKDPESGTAMLETPVTGTTSYPGLYTVELPEPVSLKKGDSMAVVITFQNSVYVYADQSETKTYGTNTWRQVNVTAAGESFTASSNGIWRDLHDISTSLRINALTKNVKQNIETPVVSIKVTEPENLADMAVCSLEWQECQDAKTYEVYRSDTEEGTYELLAELDSSIRAYQDEIETKNEENTYFYKVRAVYSAEERDSEAVNAVIKGKIPFSIDTIAATWDAVKIAWNSMPGAAGYQIEKRKDKEEVFYKVAEVAGGNVTSYTEDVKTEDIGKYEYRVRAYAENGRHTEWSEIKTVTVPIEEICIESVTQLNENALKISWDSAKPTDFFAVYRSETVDGIYTVIKESVTEKQYTDENIITGKTYYYKVRAARKEMVSDLETTIAKPGQTKPDSPVCRKTSFYSITIENNTQLAYAISEFSEQDSKLEYRSSSEEELTFDGLQPDKKYYIFVRTKTEITGELPVMGGVLAVSTLGKTPLTLSPASMVISKGNSVPYTLTAQPGNVHYSEETVWSAYDEKGRAYETEQTKTAFSVKGSDGEEILRVANGRIYASADSIQKEVHLQAQKGGLTAWCSVLVNVPVTALAFRVMKINDDEAETLGTLKVGDRAELGVIYTPANADDTTVYWSTSNRTVAMVEGKDSSTIYLHAKGAGECVLKAYTADGVQISRKITVKKAGEVYGMWIAEKSLSGLSVIKEEDGTYKGQDLDAKPVYELAAGSAENLPSSIKINAYALNEENAQKDAEGNITGGTLRKADQGDIVYQSSNPAAAVVDADGTVTAKAKGETTIYAFDTKGNDVYGMCQVNVSGERAKTENPGSEYPIEKGYKLQAVTSAFWIESYGVNAGSNCLLQVKNQFGTVLDQTLFTYTSSNPSVCMVDDKGKVTPNPEYDAKKNTSVKITAALKQDPAKRKVTFQVIVVPVKQAAAIQIQKIVYNGETAAAEAVEEVIGQQFRKGDTLVFSASAFDSRGNLLENPALTWSLSDSSLASLKVNKDKTVTVTLKKAGRIKVICKAKDAWKRSSFAEIAAMTVTPVVSAAQVNLNKQQSGQTAGKISDSFFITAQNGTTLKKIEIVSIRKNGKDLSETESANFKLAANEDTSYGIVIENANGFADGIKNNTVYEAELAAVITGIPYQQEGAEAREHFKIKVKVTSKQPEIRIKTCAINRIFAVSEKRTGLLDIKAPGMVTDITVLSAEDGQINNFDTYFHSEKEGGQWYLKFTDTEGTYRKTSLKGKISVTVEGYEPVVKTITVKTPAGRPSIKQQNIPSIHTAVSKEAEIILYNNTDKEILSSFRIENVTSDSLEVTEKNGALHAVIKEQAQYKNGASLSAAIEIMATEEGRDIWTEPVSIRVSVKAYTVKEPVIVTKAKTLTLNKQTAGEETETAISVNYKNVSINESKDWQVYAYNGRTKKYDLQGTGSTDWITLTYEEESNTLKAGFCTGKAENIKAGSYKFRILNVLKGFEDTAKDITVKVIDKAPAVSVKMSGKLDLVNRENVTLAGKLILKNISAKVKAVKILGEDKNSANAYYEAAEFAQNSFLIKLTKEGLRAPLTTEKTTLQTAVELENGQIIYTEISFKPTQSIPKINVPAAQTIYKSVENLTRDYDMTKKQTAGTKIKKMDVVNAPAGIGVITKNGHVLVTVSDRGIKKGTYKIKVKIYFEGAQPVFGYPDGKPLTKTIQVKVAE